MVRNRIELAEYFNYLEFKKGAEVGVADGRYSEILCQKIRNLRLHCIDLWKPYDHNWRKQEYQDKAFEQAKERLKVYDVVFHKNASLLAAIEFPANELDFVFIDGGHTFDDVMQDILIWSKIVRPGGIIAGHDYYQFKGSGVIQAVNAYVEEHKIDLNLTLRDPGGHKDDQCPCWWWVKK